MVVTADIPLAARCLEAGAAEVFDVTYSDHCPVAIGIELPEGLRLASARPVITVESGGWL